MIRKCAFGNRTEHSSTRKFKNTVIAEVILFVFPALSGNAYCSPASELWHKWRNEQQRFPIATWAYFQRFPGTLEEYQIYADAHMTMVTAPLDQFENAVGAGLDVLIAGWEPVDRDPDLLAKYIAFSKQHPQHVIGYQLMDEPNPTYFSHLGKTLNIIYQTGTTNALSVIDLLPNWAWQRNARRVTRFGYNYAEKVEKFIREVRPPVLLNCHYPPMADGSDRYEYYPNMEHFRDLALRHNIGMMVFVLTNHHWNYRNPSESDVRWQVYTALAYGAQGIWYWNWRIKPSEHLSFERGFGEGLVSYETGEPTPAYHHVKAINIEIQAIGQVLMRLQSRAVFHTGEIVPDGTRKFTHTGDSGWSAIERFYGDDFIIGEFKNQDDQDDQDSYIMLVNKRHGMDLNSSDITLRARAVFKPTEQYNFVYKYDRKSGEIKGLETVSHFGKNNHYALELEGGQGVLLRFSRTPLYGKKFSQNIN